MSEQACSRCGHVGEPAVVTPGSMGIEVVLWLCFLIPGLAYSLWRHHARHEACALCNASDLVPLNSPKGRQALAALPATERPRPPTTTQPSAKAVGMGHALGAILRKLIGRR